MRALILCLGTMVFVPMTVDAQAMRGEPVAGSSAQRGAQSIHAASGPTIEAAAIGIRLAPSSVAAVSTESKARRRSADSHDVALIVVGVGAMVAGGVIGGTAGTIFLVGGAVIGLYGLFNLLQ